MSQEPSQRSDTQPPQSTNKNKLIVFGVVVALLAAALAAAGAYLLTGDRSEEVVIEEATSPAEDETVGWETYRNEKYGFEVKYPPTWFILDGEVTRLGETSFRLIYSDKKEDIDEVVAIGGVNFLTHGWGARNFQIYITTTQWPEPIRSDERSDPDDTVIDLDGVTAYKFIRYGVGEIGPLHPSIKFNHKDRGWIISWPTRNENTKSYNPIYDQILSTFKFIEP